MGQTHSVERWADEEAASQGHGAAGPGANESRSTRGGVLVPELPLDAEETHRGGETQAAPGDAGKRRHAQEARDGRFMAEAARSNGPRPDLARNDIEDLRGSSMRAVATTVT